MRPSHTTRALALGVLAFAAACSDSPAPTAPTDVEPDLAVSARAAVNVIVVLNSEFSGGGHAANQAQARSIARSLGVSPSFTYGTALFGFAGSVPEGRLNALRNDPRVSYVEMDQIVSLAPPSGRGPPGRGDEVETASGQKVPWGITRVGSSFNCTPPEVDSSPISTVCTGRTVWIIDTGIDLHHPDLNVDGERSVDFTGSRKGAEDENGHGTHVAGTIAAKDNDFGVVGVAAGATVVAVRVLNRRGSGTMSGVIMGVVHVAANANDGDVANMSLGGGFSQALNDAVIAASANVSFALAAGNESTDASNRSPASAEGKNIYTVSAFSEEEDRWASFSNFGDKENGGTPVDYGAPGVGVLSTYKGGGYATLSGTSMAAPHVAGILLLGAVSSDGTVIVYSDGTVLDDPDGVADPIATWVLPIG